MTNDALEAMAEVEETPPLDKLIENVVVLGQESLDERALRGIILRIRLAERDLENVQALATTVLVPYRDRAARLQANIDQARDVLLSYVIRNGTVRFPDLATVSTTTVAKGGKAKVTDVDALTGWLEENGIDVPMTEPAVDVKAALELVLQKAQPTPRGELVGATTGEVIEVPGIGVQPEGKSLSLRKA